MWSAPVTVTPPDSEPLTLAIVKEFLAIEADETLHDAKLGRFIAAARAQAEAITGTFMVPQTVRLSASDWSDLVHLPIGPVTAATQIEWQDTEGDWQTLDPTIYDFGSAGLVAIIRLKPRQCFPFGKRSGQDTIRVTLEVGYPELPAALETAMLIMVADQFAQRESFVTGTIATKVPTSMQVENLLANYRIWL